MGVERDFGSGNAERTGRWGLGGILKDRFGGIHHEHASKNDLKLMHLTLVRHTCPHPHVEVWAKR